MNTLWLAERLLEIFFYGEPFADLKCVERFLQDIKIPSEKIEDISSSLKSNVERKLFMCVPDYSSDYSYDYYVTEMGDVIITELGKNSIVNADKERDLLDQLESEYNNGDYLPERYKRLLR